MQTYKVRLESEISKSFRCVMAANSLDIDVKKKSIHELLITADLDADYNIGLIIGSSGSGKTTLAKQIFGKDCFNSHIEMDKPVIDQFPQDYTYDQCASILSGVGLTSVPCWIRPVYTLSNGQKSRAEIALAMCNDSFTVIDEWTSVVDRTVAKVMSHCVQKHIRNNKKKIVLLSCHYDVVEWLNPDWIIDCNTQKFIDRRLLHRNERERKEKLNFEVRKIGRESWRYFSKYHYLSENLPGGKTILFGLFHGPNQVGFMCFSNYVPIRKNSIPIFHSNRIVIHPDYAGFGLGIKFVDACCFEFKKQMKNKVRIMSKFSSIPMYKATLKNPFWKLLKITRQIGAVKVPKNLLRKKGYRENIKTYTFEFIG